MRPDVVMRIAKKELTLFFASPIGYLFLLVFLLRLLCDNFIPLHQSFTSNIPHFQFPIPHTKLPP